jgi:drug/metabolite transporter (DMT)-like permease
MPLVILLFALFASLFTFSKSALGFSEPFFLIGSRMALAGLLLLVHQLVFNRSQFVLAAKYFIPLLILGVLNIYLTNAAEIWGLQYMSSAKACLIYSLSPFLAAFVAYLVLKETLTPKKWIGLILGFVGLIPILFVGNANNEIVYDMLQDMTYLSWPEIALLIAVISSVYGWILLKKVVKHHHLSPIMANGVSMLIGGVLALTHSYFTHESWSPIPVAPGYYLPFLEITIWMTLISNVICYNLYGHLLKKFSATFMSLSGLVTPLFATFFGWYFLEEEITWHYFASMIIFSFGLFVFYQEELAQSLRERKEALSQ